MRRVLFLTVICLASAGCNRELVEQQALRIDGLTAQVRDLEKERNIAVNTLAEAREYSKGTEAQINNLEGRIADLIETQNQLKGTIASVRDELTSQNEALASIKEQLAVSEKALGFKDRALRDARDKVKEQDVLVAKLRRGESERIEYLEGILKSRSIKFDEAPTP